MNKKLSSICRIWVVIVCLFTASAFAAPAEAFWGWGDDVLVTIDDVELTTDDYLNWWKEWREPEMPLPASPEEYIEWNLLLQEAERMELQEKPAYRQKIEVFLKVRALMRLRYEEVTLKRREPTDENLRPFYEGVYAPQYNLHLLALSNEEQVEIVRRALESGLVLEEAAKLAGLADAEHQMEETGLMRPTRIPEAIRETVLGLGPDQNGGPVFYKGVWYFMKVLEKKDGTREDFESLKESLVRKFTKSEDDRLTRQLMDRLKQKYNPRVDKELIDQISLQGVTPEEAKKIVLQVDKRALTAGELYGLASREFATRTGGHTAAPGFDRVKESIVYGTIEQTLLGKEALDRNYQDQEPLKSTYEFYLRHRLVKELENELIMPLVAVSEDDVRREYQENPDKYLRTPGGIVEYAMVETQDAKLAEILQGRLRAGENYEKVMKVLNPGKLLVRKVPAGHLEPELAETLEKLAPGQASSGIAVEDRIVFVKLLKRVEKDVYPFEKVADSIRKQLHVEAVQNARRQVLDQLSAGSEIVVDMNVWKELRERLAEQTYDQK